MSEESSPETRMLDRFDGCVRDSIPVVGEFIIPKHLGDLGKDRDTFAMSDTEPLMERVINAVEFCAGKEKAKEIQSELRKIVREFSKGVIP